ncbi:PilZ domain-containing protein [Pseudomonadota bacterium]
MKENTAILSAEPRQADRYEPFQSRKGKLSLVVEGQTQAHDVQILRDISPFGLGVEASLLIEAGKRIHLTYEEADLSLAVVGTVAWHRKPAGVTADASRLEQYHLGVELCPANIAKNVHFFRYLSGVR